MKLNNHRECYVFVSLAHVYPQTSCSKFANVKSFIFYCHSSCGCHKAGIHVSALMALVFQGFGNIQATRTIEVSLREYLLSFNDRLVDLEILLAGNKV